MTWKTYTPESGLIHWSPADQPWHDLVITVLAAKCCKAGFRVDLWEIEEVHEFCNGVTRQRVLGTVPVRSLVRPVLWLLSWVLPIFSGERTEIAQRAGVRKFVTAAHLCFVPGAGWRPPPS